MALGFSPQAIPWSKPIKLYSVCQTCDRFEPLDERRKFGDFDRCKKCGNIMDMWTTAAVNRAKSQSR